MAKRVPRHKEERIHRSSGNVFTDLGFPPEEAAHLLIRSDLMIQLESILKERGLTQAKAAKLLGVSQPRISDVVRGRSELFSIDTLVDMLARLGVSVTLRMRRSRRVAYDSEAGVRRSGESPGGSPGAARQPAARAQRRS